MTDEYSEEGLCLGIGIDLVKEAQKVLENIKEGYKGSDLIATSYDLIFHMGMAHKCDPTNKFFDSDLYSSVTDALISIAEGNDSLIKPLEKTLTEFTHKLSGDL